jgi:hypothetical protein
MIVSPPGHFLGRPAGPTRAVATPAIGFLQEPLILPFEFFFEHYALDPQAPLVQPPARLPVGRVKTSVVRQFTRLTHAGIERLTSLVSTLSA